MSKGGNKILITGSAGFIGYHIAHAMLARGDAVIGLDGMTPYYDVDMKKRRHELLKAHGGFTAHEFMLEDLERLTALCVETKPDIILHLAAQPGVRYSMEAPESYAQSNLLGGFAILEAARRCMGAGAGAGAGGTLRHVLMASTSSVYGGDTDMPYRETTGAEHPLSFYAATKKANEAMAHAYAHLYGIPITMFRFFTVYGPWVRPDMALFKFARAMLKGEAIDVYNHGKMRRDFTFVADLAEAVLRLAETPPPPADDIAAREEAKKITGDSDSLSPVAPWRVVNIGAGQSMELMDYITALEKALGMTARKNMMDMQPGDMEATHASNDLLRALTGYVPSTPMEEGIARFAEWFRKNYNQ